MCLCPNIVGVIRMEISENMLDLMKECSGAKTIGIAGHVRPDGDCVGSCMALAMYLRKTQPDSRVDVLLETINDSLCVIPGVDTIKNHSQKECYDLFFALDTAFDRIGFATEDANRAKRSINIDHHISNQGGSDLDHIIPTASSTSEIVYELLDTTYLDVDIAQALYIGIIHDTGVFQYSNTSPRTMAIASHLLSYGFDFSRIIEETFYERTYGQTEILGRALLESMLVLDKRCAVTCISLRMMQFYQVSKSELDGIVNQLKQIRGVECGILLVEHGLMEYKVSMRSSDLVDVSKVAVYFGGGGHKKAAGVSMHGTSHDVMTNLLREIELQLKENTCD